MAYVRHGTLDADTAAEFTLPASVGSVVEVLHLDPDVAEPIYFRVLTPAQSAWLVGVAVDDCEVVPTMSAHPVAVPNLRPGQQLTVKLISAGTPAYSIRAE